MLLILLGLLPTVFSLSVGPDIQRVVEGRSSSDLIDFYCREDDNTFAYDITWFDPNNNQYTPGSGSAANPRITVVDSKLSVSDVVRADMGSYRCQRISNPSEFAEGRLAVDAAPAIRNQDHIQEIVSGETSLLRCDIDRGIPEATVHWLIYQENTTVYDFPVIRNDTDPRYTVLESGLQISNVQLSDARVYRCYVYNMYGTVFFDIEASFMAAPEFVDEIEMVNFTVPVGESVALDCTAAGVPSPTYTWSAGPNPTDWDISTVTVEFSEPLQYTCTVSNTHGSISRVFTLTEGVLPEPRYQQQNLRFNIDQGIIIKSRVRAFPAPTFKWFVNGKQLTQDSYTTTSANMTALSTLLYTFTLSDVDEYCMALVSCSTNNTHGRSKADFDVFLTNSDGGNCLVAPTVVGVTDLIVTTPEPTPEPDNKVLPLILGVVAIASLLVTLLVVVAGCACVLLKNRFKRRDDQVKLIATSCSVKTKESEDTSEITQTTQTTEVDIELDSNESYGYFRRGRQLTESHESSDSAISV